ncbi:NRAMP family divalent metal transporter [Bacillus alveayuensis]|jgi:Mn2+/Fe2+ NRAMP family transporter|uniref:Mn2+/Fe2+ NRAMP family transporter n=1 Tax=Aeribacillus alveayuensis TaxID=279215 RepID=A0ABT9VPS7_9BACI|nr:NRAMP family divalent metal transporter [Bacillus alveayuensis]MDQ0162983.1 Mn2+/Fe2+ NRAMP family transporter [Bacillus alveayuensis]
MGKRDLEKISNGKGNSRLSIQLGAAFLMATSAIGPGFLTQTAVFTEQLLASFSFVIIMSIILDIGAQLNIWRIMTVANKKGQEIANLVLPGLGFLLSFAVALGGLAFNIGNIGGAGLGFNVLFGLDARIGAVITALIAIFVFLSKEAGMAMDKITRYLGALMILLMLYVAVVSKPPVGEAVVHAFAPETIDMFAIITLVGGTVGGYITFAGGHRLLDAGIYGKENLSYVTKSSLYGIGVASLMRILLFLAVLGVVSTGFQLDPANPPASVFQQAAGTFGYKIFGIVLWSAALTSVIGAAYTSVTFLQTISPKINQNRKKVVIGFIIVSTLIFALIGKPVKLLILAGAFNGLILPLALGTILIAAYKKSIVGTYKHPIWLTIFGALVCVATAYLGFKTLVDQLPKLFS